MRAVLLIILEVGWIRLEKIEGGKGQIENRCKIVRNHAKKKKKTLVGGIVQVTGIEKT